MRKSSLSAMATLFWLHPGLSGSPRQSLMAGATMEMTPSPAPWPCPPPPVSTWRCPGPTVRCTAPASSTAASTTASPGATIPSGHLSVRRERMSMVTLPPLPLRNHYHLRITPAQCRENSMIRKKMIMSKDSLRTC